MTSGETLVIDGCAIAVVDEAGTEYERGHIVLDGDRIVSVADGPAPRDSAAARYVDGHGCLATPGLVNTHHHLYQWATRGHAQEAILFEWLRTLYPIWAGIDEDVAGAAARAGLASLALSGCTLSTDHHYVFPRGAGDLLGATVAAAGEIGLRFHPTRGSMDLGQSAGGLPPDTVVEDLDTALAATADAIDRFHDPSPGARVRVAVAPCSPFSASGALMRMAAELARDRGVRLHTHLAETVEEEEYCHELFGRGPVDYMADLGWLGPDVWMAHCVWLGADAIRRFAETGTGVAHCPSSNARLGAGIAPIRHLLDAGAPVGLGVDGAASNEAGELVMEVRQALLMARVRPADSAHREAPAGAGGDHSVAPSGPASLTAREALRLATMGGARCLGWESELGSLEPDKLADLALWRLDGIGHVDIADPVAALALGPRPPLSLLLVGGRTVVEDGELRTADVATIARNARAAAGRLSPESTHAPLTMKVP